MSNFGNVSTESGESTGSTESMFSENAVDPGDYDDLEIMLLLCNNLKGKNPQDKNQRIQLFEQVRNLNPQNSTTQDRTNNLVDFLAVLLVNQTNYLQVASKNPDILGANQIVLYYGSTDLEGKSEAVPDLEWIGQAKIDNNNSPVTWWNLNPLPSYRNNIFPSELNGKNISKKDINTLNRIPTDISDICEKLRQQSLSQLTNYEQVEEIIETQPNQPLLTTTTAQTRVKTENQNIFNPSVSYTTTPTRVKTENQNFPIVTTTPQYIAPKREYSFIKNEQVQQNLQGQNPIIKSESRNTKKQTQPSSRPNITNTPITTNISNVGNVGISNAPIQQDYNLPPALRMIQNLPFNFSVCGVECLSPQFVNLLKLRRINAIQESIKTGLNAQDSIANYDRQSIEEFLALVNSINEYSREKGLPKRISEWSKENIEDFAQVVPTNRFIRVLVASERLDKDLSSIYSFIKNPTQFFSSQVNPLQEVERRKTPLSCMTETTEGCAICLQKCLEGGAFGFLQQNRQNGITSFINQSGMNEELAKETYDRNFARDFSILNDIVSNLSNGDPAFFDLSSLNNQQQEMFLNSISASPIFYELFKRSNSKEWSQIYSALSQYVKNPDEFLGSGGFFFSVAEGKTPSQFKCTAAICTSCYTQTCGENFINQEIYSYGNKLAAILSQKPTRSVTNTPLIGYLPFSSPSKGRDLTKQELISNPQFKYVALEGFNPQNIYWFSNSYGPLAYKRGSIISYRTGLESSQKDLLFPQFLKFGRVYGYDTINISRATFLPIRIMVVNLDPYTGTETGSYDSVPFNYTWAPETGIQEISYFNNRIEKEEFDENEQSISRLILKNEQRQQEIFQPTSLLGTMNAVDTLDFPVKEKLSQANSVGEKLGFLQNSYNLGEGNYLLSSNLSNLTNIYSNIQQNPLNIDHPSPAIQKLLKNQLNNGGSSIVVENIQNNPFIPQSSSKQEKVSSGQVSPQEKLDLVFQVLSSASNLKSQTLWKIILPPVLVGLRLGLFSSQKIVDVIPSNYIRDLAIEIFGKSREGSANPDYYPFVYPKVIAVFPTISELKKNLTNQGYDADMRYVTDLLNQWQNILTIGKIKNYSKNVPLGVNFQQRTFVTNASLPIPQNLSFSSPLQQTAAPLTIARVAPNLSLLQNVSQSFNPNFGFTPNPNQNINPNLNVNPTPNFGFGFSANLNPNLNINPNLNVNPNANQYQNPAARRRLSSQNLIPPKGEFANQNIPLFLPKNEPVTNTTTTTTLKKEIIKPEYNLPQQQRVTPVKREQSTSNPKFPIVQTIIIEDSDEEEDIGMPSLEEELKRKSNEQGVEEIQYQGKRVKKTNPLPRKNLSFRNYK